jgi:voltage-gated potassium channel
MLKHLLVLFLLVSGCVTIHGVGMVLGLRWLTRAWPRKEHHFSLPRTFWILIRVVFGLLLLHLLQITVWAGFYQLLGCFPDFTTSFYFSATSYSTVGYGDVVLPVDWRIFGAIEAVTGVLMFGWSTGVLFSIVNHLQTHFFRSPGDFPSRYDP